MADTPAPGFSTLAIHAGAQPDPATGARATPIYQTTSFVFDDVDHAASLFNLQTYVGLRAEYNVYSREAREYISIELHTRPDKYYLIELEKGPRGDYPDVSLTFDPTIDPNHWIRRSVIQVVSEYRPM